MSEKWTAERHREDAKLLRAAMQRIAERRLGRAVVSVPLEDASDLLMALHRDGIYRPAEPETDVAPLYADDEYNGTIPRGSRG